MTSSETTDLTHCACEPREVRNRLLATALGCGLVLTADLAVVAARSGDRAAPPPPAQVARGVPSAAPVASRTPSPSPAPKPTPTPKPKPKPKPPPRLFLSVRDDRPGKLGTPRVLSVSAAGTGARQERMPAGPAHAVSRKTGKVVTSEVLESNQYYGCGVAGCSTTDMTEAGIVIRDLGGGRRKVLTKGGYDSEPSFSPDGSRIAYLSHVARNDQERDVVAVMTTTGRHLRTYAAPNAGWYAAPMWSPDGRHIAVVERLNLEGATPRVVLLPVGAGRPRVVGRGQFDQLRWAPNSRFLVARGTVMGPHPGYSEEAATGQDLWVVPADGGQVRRLTRLAPTVRRSYPFCEGGGEEFGVWDAVVSPDSRLVAYATNRPHRDRAGRSWDVQVIGVDGTGQRTMWRATPPRCAGYSDIRSTLARPLGWY